MATTLHDTESVGPHPSTHAYLGVDTAGYRHHLDRDARVVYRFDDAGRIERVTDLTAVGDGGAKAIDVYVHDHVRARVGWAKRTKMTDRDVFGGVFK